MIREGSPKRQFCCNNYRNVIELQIGAYKCLKKLQFIHKLTASDTELPKKSQKKVTTQLNSTVTFRHL